MGNAEPVKVSNIGRTTSIDAVKGIAIVLMVYGHVVQGGMHRHLWDSIPVWRDALNFANYFIYSFHMPAFFFVAGLFLAGSVKRRGTPGFVLEKAKTLLYPYVLWGFLASVALPFTSRFMMHAATFSWRDLLVALGTGNASWFLITLFVCQLFALALLRLPFALQMVLALTASFVIPQYDITVLFAPFQYFPFVVAGMWFSGDRIPMLEQVRKELALGGFAILLCAQWMLIRVLGPVTRWDRVPVGLVGITMIFLLSQAIRGSIADRSLQWFGAGSLAIFVLSPYLQGATRELVTRVFHTTHPVPYIGLTSLVTATVPVLIWSWQGPLHISWLFHWPGGKKQTLTRTPETVTG